MSVPDKRTVERIITMLDNRIGRLDQDRENEYYGKKRRAVLDGIIERKSEAILIRQTIRRGEF